MGVVLRTMLIVGMVVFAGSVHAQSLHGRYFVVVWGFQGATNAILDAHTFASFYRGDDLAGGVAHEATISWLPASGVVRPIGPQTGKNFSLDETLRMARQRKSIVKAYGPYQIKAETYQKAVERIRQLNSGVLKYTVVNWLPGAINCIAAVGGINGSLRTGWRYGFAATVLVAQHLAINYPTVDPQAAAVVGLGGHAEFVANLPPVN